MLRPKLPYKISLSEEALEEALACLRKITKTIDDLCLDLNEMRLHRNKVHQRYQKTLQNSKLQMQPQAVPVSDLSFYKVT